MDEAANPSGEVKKKGHDRRPKHNYNKQEALADIRKLIDKHGVEAARAIARARYPDVDPSTWSRWMQEAGGRPIHAAAVQALKAVEIVPAEVLPAPPSPAVIARHPSKARASIDMMSKIEGLWTDGEMLRDFAMAEQPDGTKRIKSPTFFAQAIKVRSDLIGQYFQALAILYDYEQMAEFFRIIVDEVGQLEPAAAARIMVRLQELNTKKGFNMAGAI